MKAEFEQAGLVLVKKAWHSLHIVLAPNAVGKCGTKECCGPGSRANIAVFARLADMSIL